MTLEEYEWTLKAGVKSETGTARLFKALGFEEDAALAEARVSVLRTCLRLLEEVKEDDNSKIHHRLRTWFLQLRDRIQSRLDRSDGRQHSSHQKSM